MALTVGNIYCLLDSTGARRYVGSSLKDISARLREHKASAQHDPLCSPLYRHVLEHCGGTMDGWTVELLQSVTYDPQLMPNALRHAEGIAIESLRARGEQLLNKNKPIDARASRRAYMAEWRRSHPTYMSTKSREHRERRRQRLRTDDGTVALGAFTST